jgi:hypothetical protein
MGWWGYDTGDGVSSYALMMGVPLAAVVIWGVFAVPGDPSRGGQGLVPVSGWIRLAIEAAVFGFGVWALHDLNQNGWAIALGSATALHYAISWDRIRWLIRQ